jgi:hypothetical protein
LPASPSSPATAKIFLLSPASSGRTGASRNSSLCDSHLRKPSGIARRLFCLGLTYL